MICHSNNSKYFYVVYDLEECELPVFAGNSVQVARFLKTSEDVLFSYISKSKRGAQKTIGKRKWIVKRFIIDEEKEEIYE